MTTLRRGKVLCRIAINQNINNHMTTEIELWIAPDFEEVSACMECTAYADTLD
jgi:coenzyme PQQ precursor peptide PqqA